MRAADLLSLVLEAIRAQRLRSALTMLGVVLGMGAVVLMSSIGEGTRQGVIAQFSQFGTTILGVRPGKLKTMGVSPATFGGTTHPLTVEDALALRRIPGVRWVSPYVVGMSQVEAGRRSRYTYVYGTTWEDQFILDWTARVGTFLPPGDLDGQPPVVVLGAKVARELFPDQNPLGERVRVGEVQLRVTGVMAAKGQVLGFDFDDVVVIPVRRALAMFNMQGITETHVFADSPDRLASVEAGTKRILRERHQGDDDITITSQKDALTVVDQVMDVLTAGVLAIAAIAVLVGAIGIMTIQWVSVHERTAEVGLMKALGASHRQVLGVFLAEAAGLSGLGGAGGAALGALLGLALEALARSNGIEAPVRPPAWAVPLAIGVSLLVGVLAGVLPAARAARLDPVEALRTE